MDPIQGEAHLITTLGPKRADELGAILPHEHVFVDLRTWDAPGYGEADPEAVVALMAPEIERIKALGITALVECSTVGVGRRADIDRGRFRSDRLSDRGADGDLSGAMGTTVWP